MKIRFGLLMLLSIGLTAMWMLLHLGISKVSSERLAKFESYPLLAFVESGETKEFDPTPWKELSGVADVTLQKGSELASEVANSYELGLSEEQMSRYTFPDLISISFKASDAGIERREILIKELERFPGLQNLESHAAYVKEVLDEYTVIKRAGLYADIFMALMLVLLMLLGHLNLELHQLLVGKLNPYSIADRLRYQSRIRNQSLALILVPLLLSFGVYYLLRWQKLIDISLPYWFFVLQFLGLGVSTLATLLVLHARIYKSALEPEVKIVSSISESTFSDSVAKQSLYSQDSNKASEPESNYVNAAPTDTSEDDDVPQSS